MLNLKTLRDRKGISRYKLSQLSGVRESTLQNIENSKDPNPTFKILCRIADALNVALDDFREK